MRNLTKSLKESFNKVNCLTFSKTLKLGLFTI